MSLVDKEICCKYILTQTIIFGLPVPAVFVITYLTLQSD